jgi:hypothetical protein
VTLWGLGFGAVTSSSLIRWNNPIFGSPGVMKNVLLANSPQILLSLLCEWTLSSFSHFSSPETRYSVQPHVHMYVLLQRMERLWASTSTAQSHITTRFSTVNILSFTSLPIFDLHPVRLGSYTLDSFSESLFGGYRRL